MKVNLSPNIVQDLNPHDESTWPDFTVYGFMSDHTFTIEVKENEFRYGQQYQGYGLFGVECVHPLNYKLEG